jgi:Amidase
MPLGNSTLLYNVVDSPVGSIPVTRVDPSLDGLTEEWTTRGEGKGQGSVLLEKVMYGSNSPAYDVNAMKGLPVGIQLVGKRWEDEKVIEMMKVVDGALRKSRTHLQN